MYVLEHSIHKGGCPRQRHSWQVCGFCGNEKLLEKVCAAQPDAKNWRVVKALVPVRPPCAAAIRRCMARPADGYCALERIIYETVRERIECTIQQITDC